MRKFLFLLSALGLALLGGAAFRLGQIERAWKVPSFAEVKARATASDLLFLSSGGERLQTWRVDSRMRRWGWVALQDIPSHAVEQLLRQEDRRFWHHHGVDFLALVRAAWKRADLGVRAGGASTLTMQLVDRLGGARRGSRRSVIEKFRQMVRAVRLELLWPKAQILEAYLNEVAFRGELTGIGAAAQALFKKTPKDLQRAETALLIGLLPSPAADPSVIARRACGLLSVSDCEAARQLVFRGALDRRSIVGGEGIAPHFAADWVRRSKPEAGGVVKTTLRASLQRRVLEVLRTQLDEIRSENASDAAAVVLDNASGELLAYVGGLGSESSAPQVDGARARRQAGSTLKPFLYALAFDRRIITPFSRVPDTPEGVSLSEGKVYQPENYDRRFRGDDVRASVALASSLNLPAVRLLTWLGVADFHALLENLGFSSLRAPEDYGPSLALGSADVTLVELAHAYRVLANGGVREDGQRVVGRGAAFLTQRILSDRSARYTAFGLENPLNLPFWAWAKTGTSKDMRDNWCVGATDRYTVAVWVGNLNGTPMRGVTGISGAGPAWREIALFLHKESPSIAPRPPQAEVVPLDDGFVLAGTELAARAALGPLRRDARAEIASPEDGAWFALDPDIGSRSQKLLLKSRSWQPGWVWRVNGKELAARMNAAPWGLRRRGRFHIELVDRKSGRVLDQVRVAVR